MKYAITCNGKLSVAVVAIGSLCHLMLDYFYYFPLHLVVARQLLLVSCNAKVIQLLWCNACVRGVYVALHIGLCWELGVTNNCV